MIKCKALMEVTPPTKTKHFHVTAVPASTLPLSHKTAATIGKLATLKGDKVIVGSDEVNDSINKILPNHNSKTVIGKTIFHGVEHAINKGATEVTLHHEPGNDKVVEDAKKLFPNVKINSAPHDGFEKAKTIEDVHPSISRGDAKLQLQKESFEIGDYVTNGVVEGEILNIHPKYATVVSEGKEYRIWVYNLELSENKAKRAQLYKDAFIFKGYKTKHFTRHLAESFKSAAKESSDEYAVLACLKAFDYVLGVTDTTIMENFNVVRVQIERLNRYAKKINCPELVEDVISVVEEELIKYAILEDIRYTTTDRMMVAKVIALTAGINIQSIADPINTINQAAIKLKTQQLTIQGWALLGRMLNVATRAGIKWNKDIFAPGIQREMGLI